VTRWERALNDGACQLLPTMRIARSRRLIPSVDANEQVVVDPAAVPVGEAGEPGTDGFIGKPPEMWMTIAQSRCHSDGWIELRCGEARGDGNTSRGAQWGRTVDVEPMGRVQPLRVEAGATVRAGPEKIGPPNATSSGGPVGWTVLLHTLNPRKTRASCVL
jgi:hypothetical protein